MNSTLLSSEHGRAGKIVEATDIGRFRIGSAASFLRQAELLSEEPGVYCLLLRRAGLILSGSGYSGPSAFAIGEFIHVYSGSAYRLGGRVKQHLMGVMQISTFRETLFAIDAYCGGIVRKLVDCEELSEDALTAWLVRNALVAHRRCVEPRAEEKNL